MLRFAVRYIIVGVALFTLLISVIHYRTQFKKGLRDCQKVLPF